MGANAPLLDKTTSSNYGKELLFQSKNSDKLLFQSMTNARSQVTCHFSLRAIHQGIAFRGVWNVRLPWNYVLYSVCRDYESTMKLATSLP